jgi:hypothetical protein
MRLHIISCEIFFREVCFLAAQSPTLCNLTFLPKGLHDLGAEKMLARVQGAVNAVAPTSCDAIALAYGLCNNGLVGLKSHHLPMILPRAHDCITLFLGSRARYRACFDARPGTYYRTSGWLEREGSEGANDETVQQKLGLFMGFADLVAKYGEENARYIQDVMGSGTQHYDNLGFIEMGIPNETRFREQAAREAAEKGWTFACIPGSLQLLRQLIDGDWNDDFLTITPGATIAATYDDAVVKACAGCDDHSRCDRDGRPITPADCKTPNPKEEICHG